MQKSPPGSYMMNSCPEGTRFLETSNDFDFIKRYRSYFKNNPNSTKE